MSTTTSNAPFVPPSARQLELVAQLIESGKVDPRDLIANNAGSLSRYELARLLDHLVPELRRDPTPSTAEFVQELFKPAMAFTSDLMGLLRDAKAANEVDEPTGPDDDGDGQDAGEDQQLVAVESPRTGRRR